MSDLSQLQKDINILKLEPFSMWSRVIQVIRDRESPIKLVENMNWKTKVGSGHRLLYRRLISIDRLQLPTSTD